MVCWLKLAEPTCIKHKFDTSQHHNIKLKLKQIITSMSIPTFQTRHIFFTKQQKNKTKKQTKTNKNKIVLQTKYLIVLFIYAIAILSKSGSNLFPIEAGRGKQSPQ